MEMDYESSQEEALPDAQRYNNYLNIVNAIEHIESGGKITEDWVYDQKSMLEQWREWIPDFSVINQEREDKDFRQTCVQTETLVRYILATGFNVKTYVQILKHMKKIIDTIESDDELTEFVEKLRM